MLEGYKTYIGATIIALAELSKPFGIEFDAEGVTESIMTVIGLVMVYYGRFAANPKK